MNILKADPAQVVIPPTPIETDMTLAEFLQSDLEGYEYVKGTLIPMPPTSGEHGDISTSLVLFLGCMFVRINWGAGCLHAKRCSRVKISSKGFRVKSHNF